MSTVTNVLEMSPWEESLAPHIYKGIETDVRRWDFEAPVPSEFENKYDAVISNGVLQRFNYMAAPAAINAWVNCLKDGGELHIIVPSLEWACREVLSEKPSPVCMVVLYGGQGGDGSVHTSGYTMRLLRVHLERCGLKCTRARTDATNININGQTYAFDQHYVCGVKGTPELRKS